MAGRKNPRPRGRLEAEVLACLAGATDPLTPRQVLDHIGGDLAYTTILTTLHRLYQKGAVTREPSGRAFAYQLVGDMTKTQAGLTAREMQKLLAAGVDRASVLLSFVDSLDADSERMLRDILERHGVADQEDRSPGTRSRTSRQRKT